MRTVIPKDAQLIPESAKQVFKGVIYDVYHWQQKMYDGSEATFERLKRPDTIVTLVIKDGRVIATEEAQPGRSWMFRLPGGRHDVEAEDELACAKRELHEEAGFVCNSWKLIDVRQPVSKIDWFVYLYLATGVSRQDEPRLDGGERIKVFELDFDEALARGRDTMTGFFPVGLFEQAGSIEGLLALPDISKDETKTIRLNKR